MADAFEPCYTLELTVKEGKDEEFLAIFKDNLEKSRAEPGVLQYDLLKDSLASSSLACCTMRPIHAMSFSVWQHVVLNRFSRLCLMSNLSAF